MSLSACHCIVSLCCQFKSYQTLPFVVVVFSKDSGLFLPFVISRTVQLLFEIPKKYSKIFSAFVGSSRRIVGADIFLPKGSVLGWKFDTMTNHEEVA